MKKPTGDREQTATDETLPEYDFKGGVRGKHAEAYRQGHTVRIDRLDGTTTVQHFTLAEGAVMLEPDVQEYFPDSQAVNHALRTLIELIPSKRRPRKKRA
ncbi:MAG TPA: hypothetical protein VHC97_00605 [Thermoanaerobaculia bacterium]|jgi:hypothetical protein|nr:hypothetical protein [Thermoanaerobaculia bacterium]